MFSIKVGNTPCNIVLTYSHESHSSFESEIFCHQSTIKKFSLPTTILCIFRTIASEYKNECGFDDSTLTFYWDLFSNLLTLLT